MLFHIGSNKGDTIDLAAQSVMFSKLFQNAELIKDKDAIVSTNKTTGAVTVDFTKAKLDPQEKTYLGNVIEELDKAIAIVDGKRADLGALQNHSSACNLVLKSCDFMSFCSFFFTHNVVSMIKYIMFKNCWTGWKIHCIKTIFTGVSRQVARKNTQLRHWS